MKPFIKMDFTMTIIFLIISIVIPPLFVVNLILFIGQLIYNYCKNKDYYEYEKELRKEEIGNVIEEARINIKKQIKELQNERHAFKPSDANLVVINTEIEYKIPENYFFEDDDEFFSYVRLRSPMVKMLFYNPFIGRDNYILMSVVDVVENFEELKQRQPTDFKEDIFIDERKKLRILKTTDDRIIGERLCNKRLFVLMGEFCHFDAIKQILVSIKKPSIVKMTTNDKNLIYNFLTNVDLFHDFKDRDFVSYYLAERRNLISKTIIKTLLKNKKIKDNNTPIIAQDRDKFYTCLNKYLNKK